MEHAQREKYKIMGTNNMIKGLILILMEHAQRGKRNGFSQVLSSKGLILILMEHAQRVANCYIHPHNRA